MPMTARGHEDGGVLSGVCKSTCRADGALRAAMMCVMLSDFVCVSR